MNADRVIRLWMIAAVIAVAAVAGWVSYWHAVAVVERYGAESTTTAHLLPACIDGLIVASSMVLLHCARARIPVPVLARVALALGIAATLTANCAHGLIKGPTAALIAMWPAIALVVAYELLMWLVRQTNAASDVKSDVPPDGSNDVDETSDDVTVDEAMSDETASNGYVDRRKQALALLAASPDMTGSELGRALNVSERQGLRILRSLTPNDRGDRHADEEVGESP